MSPGAEVTLRIFEAFLCSFKTSAQFARRASFVPTLGAKTRTPNGPTEQSLKTVNHRTLETGLQSVAKLYQANEMLEGECCSG